MTEYNPRVLQPEDFGRVVEMTSSNRQPGFFMRKLMQTAEYEHMVMSKTLPHPMTMNAREQMQAAQDMLASSNENISMGLRSPEDALRIWRNWRNSPYDVMPDQWSAADFIAVIGYDPRRDPLPGKHAALALAHDGELRASFEHIGDES